MAALAKAQELMSAYDISEAELGLTQESESAVVHEDINADPYKIKAGLVSAVARFTRCQGWRGGGYAYGFAGLEGDVAFATWLLDMLAAFVLRELKAHHAQGRAQGMRCPRIVSSSFVMGCAARIGERLRELTPLAPVAATGNVIGHVAVDGVPPTTIWNPVVPVPDNTLAVPPALKHAVPTTVGVAPEAKKVPAYPYDPKVPAAIVDTGTL
jgi:hypothetical protein